jgi:hypothetical protein
MSIDGSPKLNVSIVKPVLQLSSNYCLLLNEKKIWQLRGELDVSNYKDLMSTLLEVLMYMTFT